MKQALIIALACMFTGLLSAADSKQKVTDAAKHLTQTGNYSWTTSTKEADGSAGRLGPIEGKAEKGTVFISFAVGGIPVEVYLKGTNGTAKALEGWQTLTEIAETSGTAAAVVRYLRSYKPPGAESAALVASAKELKDAEDAVTGELKDEKVKELLLFGTRRREGQDEPKCTDPKGTIKFWIKDGALVKYETNVQGKVTAGEREFDVNRTTTVEIKDAGATKLEVPDEAKQKLS